MPRPYASTVVPAPVDQVWDLVRDYNGLHTWHPAIEASSLDSGTAAEVGAIRRLTLAGGGGVVVERLLSLDVSNAGETFTQWWAEYDAEGADEAELTAFFSGAVFADGLAALRQRFA
jgi:hypothetical protein